MNILFTRNLVIRLVGVRILIICRDTPQSIVSSTTASDGKSMRGHDRDPMWTE